MAAFHDYVRGRTEALPEGYTEAGMRVYRHLVRIGVEQAIEGPYPDLRESLGETAWRLLVDAFIRQSAWSSHHCGDLSDEFLAFVAREAARGSA